MSQLMGLVPNITNLTNRILKEAYKVWQPTTNFHSLTGTLGVLDVNPGGLFNISTRTNIRVHFPRPSERKRIKRHGWKARMSTPEGRRIIMNRILKGRFVYTH